VSLTRPRLSQLGVGGAPAALALYSEFLPAAARGQKLLIFLVFFSIGSLLEALIGAFTLPAGGWRLLLAISAVPSLALFVACWLLLPESIRFNVVQGRNAAAERTLRHMAERNGSEAAMTASLDGRTLCVTTGNGPESGPGSPEPLETDGGHVPKTILSSPLDRAGPQDPALIRRNDRGVPVSVDTVATTQSRREKKEKQLCGMRGEVFRPPLARTTFLLSGAFLVMACAYYGLVLVTPTLLLGVLGGSGDDDDHDDHDDNHGPDCYKSSLPNQSEFLLNALVTGGELPGLFAAIWAVERWGRRPTIAFFFTVSASFTSVLALLYMFAGSRLSGDDDGDQFNEAGSEVLVAFAVVLLFFGRASALAYNQSLWVYTAEAFPTSSRTTGLGVTTLAARVGGVVASSVLAPLFIASAPVGLLTCAACCVAGALIVTRLPRETTGVGLTDV
jgi:hypothetical protein